MANNVLTAQINVTAPGVASVTALVKKGLDGVTITAIKTGTAVTNLQKQVAAFGGGVAKFTNQFNQGFKNIPSAVVPAANAIAKIPGASKAATNSLINLGRVAQDAPFGFLGIANNLNPLLESFQRLKATTGSTGGALKALTSSLTGAGGIGLALSVVSSLLIVFGDEIFKSGKKVDSGTIANDRFSASLDKIKDSIKDLKDALDFSTEIQGLQLELSGVSGTALDISKAQIQIANNNDAIARTSEKLQPLTDQLESATNAAKNTIAAFNRLRLAAEKQPVIESTNLRGDIVTRANPAIAQAEAIRNLSNAFKQFFETGKVSQTLLDALSKKQQQEVSKLQELTKTVNELSKTRNEDAKTNSALELKILIDKNKQAKEENDKAKAAYDKYVSETIALGKKLAAFFEGRRELPNFTPFDSLPEELEKAKKIISDFKEGTAQIIFRVPVEFEFDEEKTKEILRNVRPEELPKLKIPAEIQFLIDRANEARAKAAKFGEDTAKAFTEALQSTAAAGISSFAESIGAAFAGGGNPFKDFANTIANGVQELGKQFIKLGVVALLAKKAIAQLFSNPAVAIAAGFALVAVGAALKTAMSGGIQARAGGGPVGGGQMFLVGEKGPELFVPNTGGNIIPNNQLGSFSGASQGGVGGVITLRLAGNDLVAALALNQLRQGRLS